MKLIFNNFGNTTLRVSDFSYKIENIMRVYGDLVTNNPDLEWKSSSDDEIKDPDYVPNNLQYKFYNALVKNELMKSKSVNMRISDKEKNARQKSAPLEDIGLIDRKSGKILGPGRELLSLLNNGGEKGLIKNEFIPIDNLSLWWLKRLYNEKKSKLNVKTRTLENYIKFFKSFDGSLNDDQFWLLPLYESTSQEVFTSNLNDIKVTGRWNILRNIVSECVEDDENFEALGNKKGKKNIPDVKIFRDYCLKVYDSKQTYEGFISLIEHLNHEGKPYIRETFLKPIVSFGRSNLRFIEKNYKKLYSLINGFIKENGIKDDKMFFIFIKTFYAYGTLNDYVDLNTRYLKLTNCFKFIREKISFINGFDLIVSHPKKDFLKKFIVDNDSFEPDSLNNLIKDPFIKKSLKEKNVSSIQDLSDKYKQDQIEIVKKLLKTKFTVDVIIDKILPLFKDHQNPKNIKTLRTLITKHAKVPAMFEYVIALVWCHVDNNPSHLINSARLFKDSDYLPVSHATGGSGNADFIAEYDDHLLHIEPTLTRGNVQKENEHEPITRHFGHNLMKVEDSKKREKSYCIFVAPYLGSNMLVDIRNAKTSPWYDTNDEKKFDGLNFLPLDIDDFINILQSKKDYKFLYNEFMKLINSDHAISRDGKMWYESEVKSTINNL